MYEASVAPGICVTTATIAEAGVAGSRAGTGSTKLRERRLFAAKGAETRQQPSKYKSGRMAPSLARSLLEIPAIQLFSQNANTG